MINWNKPIETMDGRKARVVETIGPHLSRIIWVEGISLGDVFIVNDEGHRCDDSAPIGQQQIIRNAPVKREGWAIKKKGSDRFWHSLIYSSKENAEKNKPDGGVVFRMEWEE